MRGASGRSGLALLRRPRLPNCEVVPAARNLQQLYRLLQQHLESFAQAAPDAAWPQRQQLAQRLVSLFRQFRYQPAAIFVHLLLVAMDVERLRGNILQRRLFPVYREDSI